MYTAPNKFCILYTCGESDVILSTAVAAAMFEVTVLQFWHTTNLWSKNEHFDIEPGFGSLYGGETIWIWKKNIWWKKQGIAKLPEAWLHISYTVKNARVLDDRWRRLMQRLWNL